MAHHHLFSIICTGALAVALSVFQNHLGSGIQSNSELRAKQVHVKSVVKVFLAKDTPGYSIAYEYDFPHRRSVYIKGFGTVSAKGSFRYLTADKQLEFRDSPDGEVLAIIPLQETVIVAARPALLSTPNVEDFPREFHSFIWASPKTLQEQAQLVVNKYFLFAPNSDCDKDVAHLKTTFMPLQLKGVSASVTAQVALLFSFPCAPKTAQYSFEVHALVMEGRTHSDTFRPTRDPDILRSADNFVQNLLAQMNAGQATKQ